MWSGDMKSIPLKDPNLITTEAGEFLAEIEHSQTRNGAIELPAAKVA